MVQYKQTSKNYFQKIKSDGTKVRVSKEEFMKHKRMKGGENKSNTKPTATNNNKKPNTNPNPTETNTKLTATNNKPNTNSNTKPNNKSNRSKNNWQVHANALQSGKKMVAVAVFEKKGNVNRNVKQLAKNLESELNLNKIGNKKRHPVWIQSTNKIGKSYYTVFLALNKNENEFNNEKKEVIKIITNLGNKNVTTNELLKNIRESTLNNSTRKNQVEKKLKEVLKNSNLNPNAKVFKTLEQRSKEGTNPLAQPFQI